MSDDDKPNLSPYPLSRLAPAFDLVDLAAQVQRADATLSTITGSKLKVIADQIRALQAQATAVLERAARDAELHRARCPFEKRPGQTYHLYRENADGALLFSLVAPDEWILPQPHHYEGSYRLESDMSFTPLGDVPQRDAEDAQIARLLAR